MEYNQQDKTIALAGIYQSAILVQEIARKGTVADAQLSALLETLFRFDANSVLDVYGDTLTVKKGLTSLINQLTGKGEKQDMELTRYVISLLHLEKTLDKSNNLMSKLGEELEKTHSKIDYFNVSHENIIASLAEIYQQNISPLGPKIMVQGEQIYLSQQYNVNKVRALLFAGIRSIVLWRQCGGSRWQLLLSRKKYINCAQKLLEQM